MCSDSNADDPRLREPIAAKIDTAACVVVSTEFPPFASVLDTNAPRTVAASEDFVPRYFFDIKDLVDPSGRNCKSDDDAIAMAKVLAIGVSLDKPAVDPERHIALLNEARVEIFRVPVYSTPSAA